ncbi:MAG: TonB-dependent receptor plug domain-containing protein, partial [Spongiibacteraceae bacterium]
MSTLAETRADGYREVMVVSGVYREHTDFDLPFAIDRIDATGIHDGQPGINLSEALVRVPGIVVQNRQNYAQDLQVSARGFGARAAFGVRGIKLIADGIPASTPDGQGQAATFNLDVADRIEILRGPAATLYGSNAGGVLQMFSRDGIGTPRVALNEALGSDRLNKWQLTAEGAADDVGFVLNTSRLDTDGYRDHSAARRDQQFAKLNASPDTDSHISLIYSALEQNQTEDPLGQTRAGYRDDPRSVVANAIVYDTRKSIDHQQLGASYERDFDADTLQLNLYFGRRDVEQYLAIPKGVAANESGDGGVVDFDRVFGGAGLRWLHTTVFLAGETHSVLGVDFNSSRDDRRGFQNYRGDVLGVKGALRRDERDTVSSLEPYVQIDWARQHWTVAGGLRHSRVGYFLDHFFVCKGDVGGSAGGNAPTPSGGGWLEG